MPTKKMLDKKNESNAYEHTNSKPPAQGKISGGIGKFFMGIFRRREIGVFLALVIIVIVLAVATPYFLKPLNLFNIARQISLITVVGVGMTFLIISGEFDLSVGSVMGFSAILIATFMKMGINPWLAFIIVAIVGACIGFINGIITTKIGLPSFIATLGMLSIIRGLTLVVAKGWPISGFEYSSFFFTMGGRIADTFPMQAIWMLIILILGGIVMTKTTFGHHVYGTGGNKQAAKLAGVNTDRVKITNFMITSVLAVFAGALMLAFLQSADPLAGSGMELNVIAATVIGGTNLFGGAGTILGTFLGATIMGSIRNGMVLLGISAYWQEAVIGFVIIGAVSVDLTLRRRKI